MDDRIERLFNVAYALSDEVMRLSKHLKMTDEIIPGMQAKLKVLSDELTSLHKGMAGHTGRIIRLERKHAKLLTKKKARKSHDPS